MWQTGGMKRKKRRKRRRRRIGSKKGQEWHILQVEVKMMDSHTGHCWLCPHMDLTYIHKHTKLWNNAVPINKTINAFPPIHKTFKHHSIRTRCVFAMLWLRFAFRNDTPCNHVSRWHSHSHSHSRTIHCFLMMVLFLSFVCRISHLIVATINKSQMFYCRFVYFHSIYLMLSAIKEVKISFVCATKQIVYMWRLCVYCVWVHCSVYIYIFHRFPNIHLFLRYSSQMHTLFIHANSVCSVYEFCWFLI